MEHSFIEKRTGTVTVATANLAKFYPTVSGIIKTVRVRLPSTPTGTHTFNLYRNGVAQFTPLVNAIHVAGGSYGEKVDQTLPVDAGDVLQFDLVTKGFGSVIGPMFFEIVIDDQLPARETVDIVTAALDDLDEETGTVTLGKVSIISELEADKACRVRLYRTAAYMAADLARPIGTDPTGDHGLIVEVVFEEAESVIAKQAAIATDDEDPRTGEISYAVQNLTGDDDEIVTVTIPHLVQER